MAQKKAAGKQRAVTRAAKGQKRTVASCGLCGEEDEAADANRVLRPMDLRR